MQELHQAIDEELIKMKSESIKASILNVLNSYLKGPLTTAITGYPYEKALKEEIPEFFESLLKDRGNNYEVGPAYGKGNKAKVPLVGVFNKNVTTGFQNGYYIVLLFVADMSAVYLSLNQGVADFEKQFKSKKVVQEKLEENAKFLLEKITNPSGIQGQINLNVDKTSTGYLYQFGNIIAFRYSKKKIPSKSKFKQDFFALLSAYEEIINSSNEELIEGDFQQFANECAGSLGRGEVIEAPSVSLVKKYKRNPLVAAKAIYRAGFKCEANKAHKTFIAKSSKKNYVEAHHLIRLSNQGDFQHKLDIEENVVSLCPTCHRLIHLGLYEEKEPLLKKLFRSREKMLKANGIEITEEKFLKYYKESDH